MKVALCTGLALSLLAGAALAQTAPQTPTPPVGTDDGPGLPHNPPPPPPGDRGGRGWDAGDMGRERPWHHSMAPPSKAARFRIETGDVKLGIKCADDEPMKSCADFTLQLLDELNAAPAR